jgi:hypothetical protein
LGTVKRLYFRSDAAFANPEMYEFLEAESIGYAIRLPPNRVLQDKIGYALKRLLGRPPHEVRRYHASFSYQTHSWKSRGEWWRRSNGIRVSFTRVSTSSSPTTSLKEKLIKIPLRWSATAGTSRSKWRRSRCHGKCFGKSLSLIARLRAPPASA